MNLLDTTLLNQFPSPYGVSFILMFDEETKDSHKTWKFPSPYGVLFILIFMAKKLTAGNLLGAFPSPYGVSFILSLWSKSFLSQYVFRVFL